MYPYAFIAHVGLKAADMMSSVDANAPPRNVLPSRLGTPFWSHGGTGVRLPRYTNTAQLRTAKEFRSSKDVEVGIGVWTWIQANEV